MRAEQTILFLLQEFVQENNYMWPEKTTVEPTKEEKFGDMATNLAMMLTKQAKKPPRDVAFDIKNFIESQKTDIERIDIAGPGFLNFFFSQAFWQHTVLEVLEAGSAYGRQNQGQGKKIQIEYVSTNPTGPLHIGHARGAALGDALTRLMRATGYDVSTEYYINDAGRQMYILGISVWYRLQGLLGCEVKTPADLYEGDYIKDIAQNILEQKGKDGIQGMEREELFALCRETALQEILADIKKDLDRFHVEHQVWFSEKELLQTGAVEKTFTRLKEAGLAYEKDGALWFCSTNYGDDKDRVLKKSDGALTYFASDIAYHANKYERGFEFLVNIWGADHHGYVPRMKGAVEALGYDRETLHVQLVQLVSLLRGGEPIPMSTRKARFETLAHVLDEVGSDAARFMLLLRKSDAHLDFDLDLVKQKSMENPVFYVQYANARIHSVKRKAAADGITLLPLDKTLLQGLDTAEDRQLLRLLEQYPDTVALAAKTLSPHRMGVYLRELAGALHSYYHEHHILRAEDTVVQSARLALLDSVAIVLQNGLELLGVSAPEKM